MESQDNNQEKDKNPKTLFLDQIKNNICKIISSDKKIGTGFFCQISFPQSSSSIKVLITNNHVLADNDITPEKNIQLILYNEQSANLSIGDSRKIYTDKLFDITIIEIKSEDNLNIGDQLLKIDEQVIDDNAIRNNIFKDKSVYLCDFSNKEIICSVGLVQEISSNDYSIQSLCFNKKESLGGPMFNSSNSKIIGIHKGSKGGLNWKYGTFIRGPIEHFNQKYNLNLIPISNQNNFNPMYQGNMNNNINQNQFSNYNYNMNGNQNNGYQSQNMNYNNNYFNQNTNQIQNMNNYTNKMINFPNQNMDNFNQNQNMNSNQNQNMNNFNQNMNNFNQNQNMNNNNQNMNNFNQNQNMNNNQNPNMSNFNQNMNNYNQNQNMNNNNQNMNNNIQNMNNNNQNMNNNIQIMNNNNQNMNNYNQNQNMNNNNQKMNNNNQNINNYNQNQNLNNYNNYTNNTQNNYQQNMNNNNFINNNINMNYNTNNNNSNMNNNNINYNSNYNMNQNNNIYNQNYNSNMNINQYNISEIKSLYCFRFIKEDKLNIIFSIYQCTYIKTQIPKFITKNELYYIADSIKNKTLFEFSDPNGIELYYNNNKIPKDDSDIKFLKDNSSIQIKDNSSPEYDYTDYKNNKFNINNKQRNINLFFYYDCMKYNMQFPNKLPFNEVTLAFFSKYAIEKSNRDKFTFKLGSLIIEPNNTTSIENLQLTDTSNLKIEAIFRDPYKKIEYPGKHIKAILSEKFGDLKPNTIFHVGTLQQINKLYEQISNELEKKNKKKDINIFNNKFPFTIVINEKEISPKDEIIFSSFGIKDDFPFKLINKTVFFKKH